MRPSLVGSVLVVLAACAARSDRAAPRADDAAPAAALRPPTQESAQAVPAEAASLPPLSGEWLERLSDERGEIGFVAIPIGTRSRRPVVVALHGALDDPSRSCSEWRAVFGPEPFVVCPHGDSAGVGAYVWGDPRRNRAAIERAVRAAAARYQGRLDLSAVAWASYSQSGMLAAETLRQPGLGFTCAVFFEGVPRSPSGLEAALTRAGIRRALFVNQQESWSGAHAAAARAVAPGVDARHAFIGPFGHFIRGETLERLRAEVPWLTAGDPAWGPFPP